MTSNSQREQVVNDQVWDLKGSLEFIRAYDCKVVALQFPDELLKDASLVVKALSEKCKEADLDTRLYLMADSSYNSLGVDEVCAAHVNADAVIHYGRASFSPLSNIPAYFVLGQNQLDISALAKELSEYAAKPLNPEGMKALLVFLDQPYLWAIPQLKANLEQHHAEDALPILFAECESRVLKPQKEAFSCAKRNEVIQGNEARENNSCSECQPDFLARNLDETHISSSPKPSCSSRGEDQQSNLAEENFKHCIAGYTWTYPPNVDESQCIWIWVGPDDTSTLLHLHMTYNTCEWAMLEPNEPRWQHGIPLPVTRNLKRRYYLVEKAKNASIIGIVLGTLGVAGFLEATERIRKLAHNAGKKTYTFLMGKPSPAKLANFPEIEVFVLIADPQGQILDSKEFYAPIITPYEAQLAFQPGKLWTGEYRLDFNALLLPEDKNSSLDKSEEEARFSLIDGGYHTNPNQNRGQHTEENSNSTEVENSAIVERQSLPLLGLNPSQRDLIEVKSAAQYMAAKRSFQGLEAPVMGAERKEAGDIKEGRKGRAAQYVNETQ